MKSNFLSIIESAGLSPTESKLYGALLEIQEGTMSEMTKRAGVKRSSGYNSIGKLEVLGLVSMVTRGRRTYYSAVHPQRLLQIANLRQKQIEEALPKLVGAYYGGIEKPKIQMFENIDAIREVYKEAFEWIKQGHELSVFTNIQRVTESFPEILDLFKKIMGTGIFKLKMKELVYGDEAGYNYAKNIQDRLGHGYQLRLTKREFVFGDNEQFIFDNKIIYFSLQKDIFVIVIENDDLAKTQKTMFELAWQSSLSIEDFEKDLIPR